MRFQKFILMFLLCVMLCQINFAQQIDFSNAVIFAPGESNVQLLEAATVLRDVIKEHTNISMPLLHEISNDNKPIIFICIDKKESGIPKKYLIALSKLSSTKNDGYKISFLKNEQTILVAGTDERGALYGIGYLLRKMELKPGQILAPGNINISSSPAYHIRGHQLGYRPKTNAYDAWSVPQFDHYIRDLALFGANSIEIMPPKTDDDSISSHMKLPAIKMIEEQSRICKKYGLDVWMWYPNMGSDYASPFSIEEELDERIEVFKVLPKLDAVFVPGGDPGDLEPDVLFNWLTQTMPVIKIYAKVKAE